MYYPKLKKFLIAQAVRLNEADGGDKVSTLPNVRPEVDEYGQPTGRGPFAAVYENMIGHLLKNPTLQFERERIENSLTEETVSTQIATFTTFALPLVRRVMRNLVCINSGLVSVQPMRTPTADIFYAKRKYTSTYAPDGITAGDDVADIPGAYQYAQSSEKGTIREMDLEIVSKTVSAISMKLQSSFTEETIQNLAAYHNLSFEGEIKSLFADEIQCETDRYILQAMLAGAAYNINWANLAPAGDVTTADKKAYFETLYSTAMMAASMRILTYMHIPAGWAIMSPTVLQYLMRCETFRMSADINNLQTSVGIQQIGSIGGTIKVLVDPAFPVNKILMGCNAIDWTRAAAVYSPFLPLFFSDRFVMANDFSQQRMGCMSRFYAGVITKNETEAHSDGLSTVTITSS